MKEFWKDYWDLCKHSISWYKKHWKGYTVLTVAIAAGEVAWFYRDKLKEKIKEQFHKKEEALGLILFIFNSTRKVREK